MLLSVSTSMTIFLDGSSSSSSSCAAGWGSSVSLSALAFACFSSNFSLPPAMLYWICVMLSTLCSPPLTIETNTPSIVTSSTWMHSLNTVVIATSKTMSPTDTAVGSSYPAGLPSAMSPSSKRPV